MPSCSRPTTRALAPGATVPIARAARSTRSSRALLALLPSHRSPPAPFAKSARARECARSSAERNLYPSRMERRRPHALPAELGTHAGDHDGPVAPHRCAGGDHRPPGDDCDNPVHDSAGRNRSGRGRSADRSRTEPRTGGMIAGAAPPRPGAFCPGPLDRCVRT